MTRQQPFEKAAIRKLHGPDAVAQMKIKCQRPSDQEQDAKPAAGECREFIVAFGVIGRRPQPGDQQRRSERQRRTADAMQNREHGGDLRFIDLQMRGEGAGIGISHKPVLSIGFLLRGTIGSFGQ